jgi:hypothetical protein
MFRLLSNFGVVKKIYIIYIMLFPSIAFAEGQEALALFMDVIDFVKVVGIWGIVVGAILRITNHFLRNKLLTKQVRFIWIITGVIALFIWSMIKHDPYPLEGPIDSIFK